MAYEGGLYWTEICSSLQSSIQKQPHPAIALTPNETRSAANATPGPGACRADSGYQGRGFRLTHAPHIMYRSKVRITLLLLPRSDRGRVASVMRTLLRYMMCGACVRRIPSLITRICSTGGPGPG